MEVFEVEERPDLDPLKALKTYISLRKDKIGEAEYLPLFLHENGQIFSKVEFNKDLKDLLSIYPQLSTDRDSWTGHSFRSGLATVLSTLGFTEDQIKSWGRWASNAYLCYIKDLSHRREVHARMKNTFKAMLKDL